jgi:hypothetical protein
MIGLCVGAGSLLATPSTVRADHDWDLRYNAYRNTWNDHRHWRDRYYQPYYRNYYRTQPYTSRYYNSYPRTYSYRPSYGTYYYGSPYGYGNPYGYRDYRSGGAVRVGPLQFYWR